MHGDRMPPGQQLPKTTGNNGDVEHETERTGLVRQGGAGRDRSLRFGLLMQPAVQEGLTPGKETYGSSSIEHRQAPDADQPVPGQEAVEEGACQDL